MTAAEFEAYMDLLVAIVKRAQMDAQGRVVHVPPGERRQAVQWEAEQFCEEVIPEIAAWGLTDATACQRWARGERVA